MSSTIPPESKGVALVTGAAQGIGRAIALQLAADGFDLALNDIASKGAQLDAVKAEVIKVGRRAAVFPADISIDAEVKGMVEDTVQVFGGLDVMVANAGICKARGSLLDVNFEDWDHTFSVNVRGTFLCYQYAAKQMISQGRGGRIIGACSGAGKQALAMLPDYSASKFAVRGLTQAAAEQFAPLAGMSQEAFSAAQAQLAALKRNGAPEDIAHLVSFLASKESAFITGQSINADGGRYYD
ncbi:hypothetical protein MVEN_01408900 [Mycena venus]|uniref:NAD(P)-binding protein n=1 Tax=Mycena venus TaxID=2733690 RepID=A0A8H6XXC4_9AGAR|nr:hypothetical protein MVEN_01408900 [Mycena venus]